MRSWRAIFGFSKWNAINAAAHATSLRAGDFFIGKFSGPAGLGLFELSNDIAFLTSSALGAPINRAVYPGYARTANDHEQLRATFQLVIALIAILIMPAGVGLASISDSLVPIVLGPQWLAAIPLVAVLAFRGLIHALVSNVPYVYLAIGKPKLATYALVARAVLLLPLLWIGLREWGVMGAACAFTASMALEIPIHLFIVHRELQIRVAAVLESLWRPTVAAGLMAVFVRFASVSWTLPDGRAASILRLVALVGIGAFTYVLAVVGLWLLRGRPSGAERTVFDAVGTRFAAWSGRQAES
jgi:O-antigen/teichoic acid export membrane protein